MGKENKFFPMATSMKESMRTEKQQEKAFTNGKMELFTRGNFLMENAMGLVF